MGGGDGKKRKRATPPQDAPDLPSESSDASKFLDDHESAPTDQKPKLGLSGKSKSFSNLTKLGKTKAKEIAKKEHKVNKMHRQTEEALTSLKAAVRRISSARIGSSEVARVADLLDQEAGSSDGEDTKDDAGKSESGASGYQSDHSMTGAGSSDDNAEDDIVHGFNTDDEEYGEKNY